MKRISFFAPKTASLKLMLMRFWMSAPLIGPLRADLVLPPKPPKPPPNMLNMSSKPPKPPKSAPPEPNPALGSTPAKPNWSYFCFLSGSDSIEYASLTSLNFSSADLSPGLRSGWYFIAILRKADFISSSLAPFWSPSTS